MTAIWISVRRDVEEGFPAPEVKTIVPVSAEGV